MNKRKPHVGDMADHVSRTLDPRPVVEVSDGGHMIRLDIHGLITDWIPARNYTYHQSGSGQ